MLQKLAKGAKTRHRNTKEIPQGLLQVQSRSPKTPIQLWICHRLNTYSDVSPRRPFAARLELCCSCFRLTKRDNPQRTQKHQSDLAKSRHRHKRRKTDWPHWLLPTSRVHALNLCRNSTTRDAVQDISELNNCREIPDVPFQPRAVRVRRDSHVLVWAIILADL